MVPLQQILKESTLKFSNLIKISWVLLSPPVLTVMLIFLRDFLFLKLTMGLPVMLTVEVSKEEILSVIKYMPSSKAPGPDGFIVEFFKVAWEIVEDLVVADVQEFFVTRRLLKRLNTTAITLVPKCLHPSKVIDFRPITCCNIIYKCISNILANRIKRCLSSIISGNQYASIEGRRTIDNILLVQKIVKDYNQARGRPRCSLKLDIKKAFDSVRWSFVLNVMQAMGFPVKFLN